MLGNRGRIMRLKAGAKALVVGLATTGLVALAGGWAFASLGPVRVTTSTSTRTSAGVPSAGSAVLAASRNVSLTPGSRAGTPQAAAPRSAAPQVGATMPAGLLPAGPQSLAGLSLRGNSASSGQWVTGGGSTIFFHFAFTARTHRKGHLARSVTGNAEVVFGAANPGRLHIALNCLEIAGSDAYVSGVLTKPAFGLSKGTVMLFGVQDDDSVSTPDLISDIYYSPGPPFTCHTFHAKPHYAVRGKIEIR